MQLDQIDVLEVLPAAPSPGAHGGDWQCASCQAAYPVAEGFKVLYETAPGVNVVAYVCEACAGAARRDLSPTS